MTPDLIHIRRLRMRTLIGVAEWEKRARQDIILDLAIEHDQRKAAASDDLADTVSYKAIRDDLVAFIEGSHHDLLETLAERVAEHVLARPGVTGVRVVIDKPGALRFADSVAVEIRRSRAETEAGP